MKNNTTLINKLEEKKRILEIELEKEYYHVDKKDNHYKNKLINKINKIDGFILGVYYMKTKYQEQKTQSSFNSIIDNNKDNGISYTQMRW